MAYTLQTSTTSLSPYFDQASEGVARHIVASKHN
jgi:hypothetical protein